MMLQTADSATARPARADGLTIAELRDLLEFFLTAGSNHANVDDLLLKAMRALTVKAGALAASTQDLERISRLLPILRAQIDLPKTEGHA